MEARFNCTVAPLDYVEVFKREEAPGILIINTRTGDRTAAIHLTKEQAVFMAAELLNLALKEVAKY